MAYDFEPRNKAAGPFRLGAFSFPVLLEACGYLFLCIQGAGRWYRVRGTDDRFQADYPELISNDGFKVTAEEARIMARIARNFVAVQRSLPEENRGGGIIDKGSVNREELLEALVSTMHGRREPGPWPLKIRDDFTDSFEAFAEWAEKSGGFRIW